MKALFIILFFFLLYAELQGQQITQERKIKYAPFNPEFIKYQKLSPAERRNSGYVPPPIIPGRGIPIGVKYSKDLPQKYDMRDKGLITPVQDQSSSPTCWAYSATGAVESQVVNEVGTITDLSEKCASQYKDQHYSTYGGNYSMTSSYYSSRQGPDEEKDICEFLSKMDINNYSVVSQATASSGEPGKVYRNFYSLDEKDTLRNVIKQLIYEKGAVATTLYWNNSFFNPSTYTYFCNITDSTVNHAGLLIGWDDNLSTAAEKPGAWIVKNSWGVSFGDSGYYYLSYYDSLALSTENSIWYNITEHDTASRLYMNDELGGIFQIGYENINYAYGLTRFQALDNIPITSIMTWTLSSDAVVSIWIYDDFTGGTLSNLLTQSVNNYRQFAGYSMYDLPAPLYLSSGDDFYVKVKYQYPGTSVYPVPCEFYMENYCNPVIQSNKFWLSQEGNSWYRLGTGTDFQVNLAIRAYASPVTPGWVNQTNTAADNLNALCFTGKEQGFACGDGGIILKTTDGGKNWTSRSSGTVQNLTSLFFIDNNTGWAAGYNGRIFKTTDGGESWTAQTSGTNNRIAKIIFLDNNLGYAAGELGKILKTTDGGLTWTSRRAGTGNNLNCIWFTDPNTGWTAGWDGIILKTTDGGDTWTAKNSGTTNTIYSLIFSDHFTAVASAANGTILKTTDGGDTWVHKESPVPLNLYSTWFNNKNNGWITGDKGTILTTADGGESWRAQASGTKYFLNAVAFTDDNTGYAAGEKGIILMTTAGGTTMAEKAAAIPAFYSLDQNYPNPFNPNTTIRYRIPAASMVTIIVYDILGREVKKILSEEKTPGSYEIRFNAENLTSGIYIYRIQAGSYVSSKKMLLMK